jgi:MFS family permease
MLGRLREFFALERNVAVLALTSLFLTVGEGLWIQFLPKYFETVGLSVVMIGVIFSAFMVFLTIFHMLGGYFADILGRKKTFLIALAAGIPAYLFYIFARDWLFLILGNILFALVTGFSETADSIIVTESLRKNKRATGRATIHVVLATVMIIMAPVGGFLVQDMGVLEGVKLSMLVGLLLLVVSIMFSFFFLRETLHKRHRIRKVEFNPLLVLSFFGQMPKMVKYLILSRVFSLFAWSIAIPFFIFYFLDVIGIEPFEVGVLFGVQAVSFAFFTVLGAKISDRYGRKYTIIGLFASAALVPFLVVASSSFAQLLLVSVLWGMIGFGLSSIDAYTADHTTKKMRGRSIGIADTLYAASMIPGPVIGGLLFAISPQAPLIASGAVAIVAVVLGLKLLK